MGHKSSRAVALGLGAAVGAFAATAMMSAATASTAHADDFSAVIADIQAEEAAAATAFATAATDGDTAAGLSQLFIGLDDELIGVPEDLEVGTTDVLTGTAVIPASDFEISFATPTSFSNAVTEANTFYTDGVNLATTIAGLPSSDHALIALDNALSSIDQWILPDQIQLIGELAFNF